MLGFAIVDRQPKADATAVWLTCREGSRVSHTNAVVIANDDERYDIRVWNLTADRTVVLTSGTQPPRAFNHALGVDAFNGLIEETAAHQQLIAAAVADYAARTKSKNLVTPEFARTRPALSIDPRDEPEFRALAVANYIAAVWSAWLTTEEQRIRRAINPRTGTTPWIMPEGLGSPEIAEFPPEFTELVEPEPLTGRPTVLAGG
jgi:hypothetical protein